PDSAAWPRCRAGAVGLGSREWAPVSSRYGPLSLPLVAPTPLHRLGNSFHLARLAPATAHPVHVGTPLPTGDGTLARRISRGPLPPSSSPPSTYCTTGKAPGGYPVCVPLRGQWG